ncbi:homoprotocatechuate degradation operon regulator HpaR [Pseudomonas sp. S32]|nr:homoprotocatechuate degradation operon regulator HpaR [Pseudomonas sp. S32]
MTLTRAMTTPRPSLTLTLLQAREAAMAFFRPALNAHDLTEQQWRVIRILRQQGELESHQLADLACILKPSMSGVLKRLERDGIVSRRKSSEDQRRVFISLTVKGQQAFMSMSEEMNRNYEKILRQFGADKLHALMQLLDEMKKISP